MDIVEILQQLGPAGNSSSNNNTQVLVGFVSEPAGRGTISLLLSCLFTLALCVWSSVHLDLPEPDEGTVRYTWRYLKWSLLAVFGPELVVWAAWRQHISARTLTSKIRALAGSGSQVANLTWSMTHSFYAGMGGFAIDIDMDMDMDRVNPDQRRRRLYLTARGVLLLAECGLLPDMRPEEIQDKSKTDGGEKAMCCLQAGWMLVQVASRLAAGLPVTPLEINTIGHVVCALAIFVLWWHKPRWVREPTRLQGDWTRCMCAFMYMCSHMSDSGSEKTALLDTMGAGAGAGDISLLPAGFNRERPEILSLVYESPGPGFKLNTNGIRRARALQADGPGSTTTWSNIGDMIMDSSDSRLEDSPGMEAATEAMRQARWKLASEAVQRYAPVRQRLQKQQRDSKSGRKPEELIQGRPRDWPGDHLVHGVPGIYMGTTLWLMSMVFGAVHVAGWHDQFPSAVEAAMWRASSVYVVFSGLVWASINLLAHLSGAVWWLWYDLLAGRASRACRVAIVALCAVGGLLYLVARLFLVAEAFASLRALPVGAFLCPSWLLTVPHL
ncbi:hypothetical protein B0T22DRAFT_431849 [Podospora appendiculata]|uniref:Uncharacterized protein n=1 Tax=Podospora appendiculata TaxID=314037 RepID=A0AAE0X3I7_9PEZI|nr:hypothetical protein B0T22DRAFT_431849 [Podospora appendiculata]